MSEIVDFKQSLTAVKSVDTKKKGKKRIVADMSF